MTKNERVYSFSFKKSEVRELQRALLYHIDCVMIPFLEEKSKEQDYTPTMEVRQKIEILQRVLDDLNDAVGIFKEDA